MLTRTDYRTREARASQRRGVTANLDRRWDCPDCKTARICAGRPECPLCGKRMVPHRPDVEGK